MNIVGTLIAIGLVDRVGRKPLLLAGSAGMAVALGTMAWRSATRQGSGRHVTPPGRGKIALVAANLFVVAFGYLGTGRVGAARRDVPAPDSRCRLAVAAAAQWLPTGWSPTFPSLRDWSLPGTYLVYTAFALLSFGFRAPVRAGNQRPDTGVDGRTRRTVTTAGRSAPAGAAECGGANTEGPHRRGNR